VFTENSNAAFVSEGPLCIRKKELEEASSLSIGISTHEIVCESL
jgi:hypothetical protein